MKQSYTDNISTNIIIRLHTGIETYIKNENKMLEYM